MINNTDQATKQPSFYSDKALWVIKALKPLEPLRPLEPF